VYSTLVPDSTNDQANAIVVDSGGNAYIAGTGYNHFPTTVGAYIPGDEVGPGGAYVPPGPHAFATKLNASGSALLYSTLLSVSGGSFATGLAIDAAGCAHVTGYTYSPAFPTTPGAYDTSFSTSTNTPPGYSWGDAFVVKLNSSGSAPVYSTFLGRDGNDVANGIAVDAAGQAYVTGSTNSSDFPVTPGAPGSPFEFLDVFVVRLNDSGSSVTYSKLLGGSGDDVPYALALDAASNVFVDGSTVSPDFPTTADAVEAVADIPCDAFVTILNPNSPALLFSTLLAGEGSDFVNGLALDPGGNLYITGYTESPDFPTTPGAFDTSFDGINGLFGDAFVIKFTANLPQPRVIAINDVSVVETDAGFTIATFTVTASPTNGGPATVDYATADGTSQAGADYAATSGTLQFAAGEGTKTLTVLVNGDAAVEGNETVLINLTNPSNATLADAQGMAVIVNDDGPRISIVDAQRREDDAFGPLIYVQVWLSATSTMPVTVTWSTVSGSAQPGSDYVPVTDGTLTFRPGEYLQSIAVRIVGDRSLEPTESFTVNLSNPVGGVLAKSQATVTILDDDIALADLAITVSADRAIARVGESVTYTVKITNLGPQAERTFSADVMGWYIRSAWGSSPAGPVECVFDRFLGYRCRGTSLGAGQTATIYYQVVQADRPGCRNSCTFTAPFSVLAFPMRSAGGAPAVVDPNLTNNVATARITVVPR
jgi:hypothetical protein